MSILSSRAERSETYDARRGESGVDDDQLTGRERADAEKLATVLLGD